VIIEQMLVNGKPQAVPVDAETAQPIRLGPGLRSLDFSFTALNFTAPEKTRFWQKLEGFDADWVRNDGTRKAHYGQLPPRRYRFRVSASQTEDTSKASEASLSFIIVPPLWREPWMLALFGVVLVAAIWAAVRAVALRRLRVQLRLSEQRRGMERERSRIARDMHDEIGSKLTRISFLSEMARNAGAEAPDVMPPIEGIANTSRELLKALDEIVWAVNPRNDNLEHLAGYLEQYAREYFSMTSVECELTLPPRLPAVPLSAELRHNIFLAFQEALTNSLKHGQPSRIRIHMGLEPGAFEIRVEDDGRGFAAASDKAIGQDGLHNMRERLRAAGGMCEVVSAPGQGTRVLFRFPLPATRMVNAAHNAS
jgi:signal transduction histidine kinase